MGALVDFGVEAYHIFMKAFMNGLQAMREAHQGTPTGNRSSTLAILANERLRMARTPFLISMSFCLRRCHGNRILPTRRQGIKPGKTLVAARHRCA